MNHMKKTLLTLIFILLFGSFFVFDLSGYLSFELLKNSQNNFAEYRQQQPFLTAASFFVIYIIVTGLSLPGAALMTLLGGALFGLFWGGILVSFASSIGATFAFLVSRFLLRDVIQNRYGNQLKTLNQGIERDGIFYLFALRLVPMFPFFIINLLMGITPIRTIPFYLVSQLGMLPATLVYINAGTQLASIESPAGILSPGLIASFVLLGIFPIITRRITDWMKVQRLYNPFKKPVKFDFNLIVIGAGSGGLVSALIAAAVKAKVGLIEKHKMGGDCLNTGCVPSKALLSSAKLMNHIRHAENYGLKNARADVSFPDIMARVQHVIKTIEPHDSVERFTELGVDCFHGEAFIKSPWEVEINGQTLTTRNIIIASGAGPFVPPIPGLDTVEYLTSDNLWELESQPERLLVLGGGPIGCELTQAFARLGSKVTQVEMLPRLMIREDLEFSELVLKQLKNDGVDVLLEHKALEIQTQDDEHTLICSTPDGSTARIIFDRILVAVGRKANTDGFGLTELGIELRPQGTLEVNDFLQTKYPNILACGDVVGPYQFTHTAAHQAWYATVNALFGGLRKFRVDYSVIPWATFTDPEIARVGLNEQEATEQDIQYEVTHYGIDDLDRAIADGNTIGQVKVLTVPGKDKILGVTIAGNSAGELLTEFVSAMKHGLGLNKILGTIHIYPTLSEANKFAAGNWKRAHAPQGLLQWVSKYHHWLRR